MQNSQAIFEIIQQHFNIITQDHWFHWWHTNKTSTKLLFMEYL